MKNIEDYDDRVWERLLEFVFPNEKKLSRKEVQSELQKLSIDVRPALEKIQIALQNSQKTACAKANLESAKKKRPSYLAKLNNIKIPTFSDFQEKIEIIKERFAGLKPTVYYRKLESSESEEDIKTLLEDISRLEEFSKDSNDVEP